MDNRLLLSGAAFILGSVILFLSKTGRQSTKTERILQEQRRDSGIGTLPQLLSPEIKNLRKVPDFPYSRTFPPSRQHVLEASEECLQLDEDCMLPMKTPYHNAPDNMRTPCGFSIADIKALGDFPDYARLSGVPLPKPCPEFDIGKALPRPYRPFRWTYHQTMSLSKLESDWWLELESTYEERMKQRSLLFAEHGEAVMQALPGSELACKELMEMVLQFLCARYPQYFSLDGQIFHNSILKSTTDLKQTAPLQVISQNVPEDFAIMMRDEKTGYYLFRAGIICSALGWNVGTKIGLHLHEIHAPIPDYKEKMQFSMDRYFAKMPTDKPIQRGSWGLEVDQPLFVPPESDDLRDSQDADLELSRCHLRVDWQTLRRLPLSGAVVFNFKALFTPVEAFRDEPYVPSLLLKVLNDGKAKLMEYKKTWHTEHVVKPALERFSKEQVERGMMEEGWEPKTLDESPWFPGWQEKWHHQQGF